MKLGAPFSGSMRFQSASQIKDYVQAVEGMGYDYLYLFEHLLEDNPDQVFHEAFTLFGYLAGVTERIELATGVMVLPKRSTVMVARQAANADVLSGGRLRLGFGVGWNKKEFQALGFDFHNRGKRIEEQVPLLRKLWTEQQITFKGEYHILEETGINLLPTQRPIPIWLGGWSEAAIERAARIGDGWMSYLDPEPFSEALDTLHQHLAESGRDVKDFGISNYIHMAEGSEETWGPLMERWRGHGVTHVECLPDWGEGDKRKDIDGYINELRRFKAEMD